MNNHKFQQRVNPAPKARQHCREKCQRRAQRDLELEGVE